MKKILEVLRYGDNDIRFNTDIDVAKDPEVIFSLNADLALAMMTTLWGGNEISVLAVIRSLAIADLAASVNMDEMLCMYKESAETVRQIFLDTKRSIEKDGGKIITFGPGVRPGEKRC